jgi:5-methylcytosine-specific restriction endonuclease McrA
MRTLVLNAGYEPLSVVSFKRAVVLVLNGKASVLAESDEPLRSPGSLHRCGLSLATPSVILLVRYVRAPRRRAIAVSRRGVLRRDGHRCAYCQGQAATVDHVVPRSRGGADAWENLVACCLRCNGIKGNRTPDEMGWRMHQRPYAPAGPLWALRGADTLDPTWQEFLDVVAA